MASSFSINEDLVKRLYEKIRVSATEAITTKPLQFSLSSFLYNVVTLEIYPKITYAMIKNLIEICFWASLEKEEGNFNNFSVVFQPPNPDDFQVDFVFKDSIEFNITNLKKLAPAFSSSDYQIGVWFDEGNNLRIWGAIKKLLWFLSINSISSGKLLVNCLSGTIHSFRFSLTSFEMGFMNPFLANSNPLYAWLDIDTTIISLQRRGDFQRIFSNMFNQGRGGAILLVRENADRWKTSIKEIPYENKYLSKYTYGEIFLKYETYEEFIISVKEQRDFSQLEKENLKNKLSSRHSAAFVALNAISNLTTIDGATVLSENLNVLAFGVKIGAKEIKEVAITEPFENSEVKKMNKSDWKVGTRHTAAAEFVNEQRDCLAIVVSEDRKVSIISWDEELQLVKVTKNFEWMIFD